MFPGPQFKESCWLWSRVWELGMETSSQENSPQTPLKDACQVLLTIDTAAKLEGTEPWIYISQIKKVPPDI